MTTISVPSAYVTADVNAISLLTQTSLKPVSSFDPAPRWSKPNFQAFQLKTRPAGQEPDDAMNTLAIFGPQAQIELSRAKSVPIRETGGLTRDDVRTAHSVAASRGIIIKPRQSLEAMPVRPPLSRGKQIPGRYFPKPTTFESTRVVSFSMFRRYKPPVRPRPMATGNSRSLDTANIPMESASFMDSLPRLGRQNSAGLSRLRRSHKKHAQTEIRSDVKSEIFAICFNPGGSSPKQPVGDEAGTNGATLPEIDTTHREAKPALSYDPKSELHSDYYTIKRVSVSSTMAKGAVAVTPSMSKKNRFSVILRGQPKRLHTKLMFPDEDGQKEGSSSGGSDQEAYNEINEVEQQNTPHTGERSVKIDMGESFIQRNLAKNTGEEDGGEARE